MVMSHASPLVALEVQDIPVRLLLFVCVADLAPLLVSHKCMVRQLLGNGIVAKGGAPLQASRRQTREEDIADLLHRDCLHGTASAGDRLIMRELLAGEHVTRLNGIGKIFWRRLIRSPLPSRRRPIRVEKDSERM